MNLYEVAVAAPLYHSLTYGQPENQAEILSPGVRVLVPLGNRFVTGYLLGPAVQDTDTSGFQVKTIVDQLDPEPLFPAELISFFRWIADYYHHPLGEVIRTALPGGLIVRSGWDVVLTDSGRQNLPNVLQKVRKKEAWMEQLLDKGRLLPGTANTLRRKSSTRRLLKKWQEAGWLEIRDVRIEPRIRIKKQTMVGLTPALIEKLGHDLPLESAAIDRVVETLKKSEAKTLQLFFRHNAGRALVPRPELTRRYKGAGKALHGLVDRGLVTLEEQRCYRDPFGNTPPYFARPETLTQEQEKVLSQLIDAVDRQVFQAFLLFGVTGCGKTEVYLQAAARCLSLDKTVLVLVPEIALASQVEAHLYSRFGDTLALLHSGLSSGERFDQWQRILKKKARIVIGARSAVFAPLTDLGLIIVDEEHEPAYKQDNGLRYNGRDLAVLRARFADCPVLLGSATPSVTSFHNAQTGKYHLLTMRRRVHNQAMPEVTIVDLGKQKRSRPDLFFSDQLTAALHENMEQRLQSLLFVNRRGFASFMLCRDCGHIIQCQNCKVSLTHHLQSNRLVCHYCGYSIAPDAICPECRSTDVVGLGLGSERIEAEVCQLIPHARVARLDSDTTKDRKIYMAILQKVRNHEVDILIGTQMVAKGLHFPKMTLVGVVWADSGLGMPDYKASERTFQLLAQVTGRAGRGEHAGRVIIQTHQPEHYAVECARCHDYEKLYAQEQALRAGLGYPPFGRLVNIRFSGENEDRVAETANKVARYLRAMTISEGIDILGPAPAPLSRIKKRFRWQLLVKSSRFTLLHDICERLLTEKQGLCLAGVRIGLDIDPENMM